MEVIRSTAGYSMTAVSTDEGAKIFDVPVKVILDLEEQGFLAPNAAIRGKRERFYVHEIKQALIAKADSVTDDSVIVHAASLKSASDWRDWLERIFARNRGLQPKALAAMVSEEFKATFPVVLQKSGTLSIPGVGTLTMQHYPPRKVYVDSKKETQVIDARMRAAFRPCSTFKPE